MENNEILTNEEVMETTEEIVNASSGKGFKVAAGIGLAVLAGVVPISTSENRCWQKSKPKRKRRRRSPTWNSMNPMSKMRIPRIFPNKKKECSDEGKCL